MGAGRFTAGLSGGQRKMMAFELVRQRTSSQSDLLIVLDEPFAGVTDDFVPFITARLYEMQRKHNLVLVTNDHVDVLTKMADSTITVSAIDRSKVLIDGKSHERELALHALAKGEGFEPSTGSRDLSFFARTEIFTSPQVILSLGFTVFAMTLFLLSFWDSKPGQEALVLVAIQITGFFCFQPYIIALTDWRNIVKEEAEALMHSSVQSMLALKSIVSLMLLVVIQSTAFGCLVAVLDTPVINDIATWISMVFDLASLALPAICLGLFSSLPLQIVQGIALVPTLFMITFSGTFSPGAGGELVLYTILSGCFGLFLFLVVQSVRALVHRARADTEKLKHDEIAKRPEYQQIQIEPYKNAQNKSGREMSGRESLAAATALHPEP